MHERTGKWKWDVENDIDVDKNDTVTVPARERDLVRERDYSKAREQQAAAVRGGGFLSFIVLALAAVSRYPHT